MSPVGAAGASVVDGCWFGAVCCAAAVLPVSAPARTQTRTHCFFIAESPELRCPRGPTPRARPDFGLQDPVGPSSTRHYMHAGRPARQVSSKGGARETVEFGGAPRGGLPEVNTRPGEISDVPTAFSEGF